MFASLLAPYIPIICSNQMAFPNENLKSLQSIASNYKDSDDDVKPDGFAVKEKQVMLGKVWDSCACFAHLTDVRAGRCRIRAHVARQGCLLRHAERRVRHGRRVYVIVCLTVGGARAERVCARLGHASIGQICHHNEQNTND